MISIIIPTYNEAAYLSKTLDRILAQSERPFIKEVIVCDGGSTDLTMEIASRKGVKVISGMKKGRAPQMNAGAAKATGNILYFLHADTFPPVDFAKNITRAVEQGNEAGCFRLRFDNDHWFLKANSWFTRFNISSFRFGDQSLFITKPIFDANGGFNEKMIILEDQEFIKRIGHHISFAVLPGVVITSSRKYERNGIYKTQAIYFLIYCLYRFGCSQQRLLKIYRSFIKQEKI